MVRRLAGSFLVAAIYSAGLAASPASHAQAEAYLTELWQSTGTPGISVAVAVRGRLVFSEGLGFADLENLVPATPSTVYNIGSVSKVITAVAVMQLVEEGKVSLDDPIQRYVPEFPTKPEGPITIREILTHTSGIRHYRAGDFPDSEDNENTRPVSSWIDGLRIFKDDPLLFPPGRYYFYSSYAVNLLQGVVERAGGLPFEQYLQCRVWRPSGMLSTSFDVPARVVPHRARSYRVRDGQILNYYYNDLTYKFASGGMLSTAEDLVRLGEALNAGQLLKKETVALMYEPYLNPAIRFEPKGAPSRQEFAQGLIWRVFTDSAGKEFVNHCGTVKGFNACIVNYPVEDVVVAIVGNGDPVTPARRAAVEFARIFLAGTQAPAP